MVGCTDSPKWEETTVTIINDSGEVVDFVMLIAWGISRSTTDDMNALGDTPLSDGDSAVIPLPPVLADAGVMQCYATSGEDEFTYYYDSAIWPGADTEEDRTQETLNFRYDEGAEVTFHLTDEMTFTIDGAKILPPSALFVLISRHITGTLRFRGCSTSSGTAWIVRENRGIVFFRGPGPLKTE